VYQHHELTQRSNVILQAQSNNVTFVQFRNVTSAKLEGYGGDISKLDKGDIITLGLHMEMQACQKLSNTLHSVLILMEVIYA